MSASGSFGFTADPIVNNSVTDYTTDKTTTQYVNLTNNTPYNYYLRFGYNKKIKPIDLNVGLSAFTNGNVSYSYINTQINKSTTSTYGPSLSLSIYEQKKYDFYVNGGPTYNINRFSVTPSNNNNAPGLNLNGSAEVFLPGKFSISSDVRYTYIGKTQTLDANERTIMNASLNKTFFKDDNLKLSLSVNNLFNQDVNFNRNVNGNTISQSTTTGIRRYFMFSVSWDFTKFATSSSTPTETKN